MSIVQSDRFVKDSGRVIRLWKWFPSHGSLDCEGLRAPTSFIFSLASSVCFCHSLLLSVLHIISAALESEGYRISLSQFVVVLGNSVRARCLYVTVKVTISIN